MKYESIHSRVLVAAGACLGFAGLSGAADLYVGPGQTYETIQEAIVAAAANDVIHVAAGVYATGGDTVYKDTPARVKIDGKKGLKIVGAGRGKTIIRGTRPEGLGNKQSDEAAAKAGSPYRCVHIANATDVRIQDLTLECGETRNALAGGGICLKAATAILVDCDIRNCAAGYAAGASGGDKGITLVRTRITDTFAMTDGGAVTGGTALVNCVFARTASAGSTVAGSTLYNCTLADNKAATALSDASQAVNSLVILSSATLDASELGDGSTQVNSILGSADGHFQLVGPTLGDFRLLATSPARAAGLASNLEGLELPPDVSAFVDIDGRAIVADGQGRIAAGAVQAAVTPVAGRLVFTNAVHKINGAVSQNAAQLTWVYPETYPTQYQVSVVAPTGYAHLRWQRSDDDKFTYTSWKDGTAWILPCPTVGEESVYTATLANNIYFVKPDGNDDATGKATNTAWKTLAKAASGPSAKYPALVYVLPGTYTSDTHGNTFTAGSKTYGEDSIFAVNNANLVIRSLDGPEATIIKGKDCSSGDQFDAANYPGCGAGALKIAVLRNSCALIGFTLTGGRADADDKSGVVAAMASGGTPQLQDCIISNNVSTSYGVNIDAVRCRTMENISKYDAMASSAAHCIARDNTIVSDGYGAFRNYAIFSTAIGTPRQGELCGNCKSVNSIWDGGETISSQWSGLGSICWNYDKSSTKSAFEAVDPLFAHRAASAQLLSVSPAVDATVAPTAANCTELGRPWYLDVSSDVDGKPVYAGEAPVVGGVQSVVSSALIGGDVRGGYAYEGVTEGAVALDESLSFKVVPAAGTRPCIGVEVNGVLRPFTNAWSEVAGRYEIALGAVDAEEGALTVQPVYSTDWYADDDGDDSNSGFLPKLAKKTLDTAEAMLADNDTLWVLPGTYNVGSNRASSTETIWSRLVVHDDHTVISTEGPEKTFIVGADATIEPDDYGCGVDALRCVTVMRNGTLSGFTLTGGRVDRRVGAKQAGMGAGVIGETSNGTNPSYKMRVENCIISNCVAAVGAAATRVQLARSRVYENTATSYGSGVYQACVYGCFFDRNKGSGVIDHSSVIISSTVGDGNRLINGNVPNAIQSVNNNAQVINTLLLQPLSLTAENTYTIRHCAVPDTSSLAGTVLDGTCIMTNAANLALEADGRPKVRANVGVDRGSLADFTDEYGFLDPLHDTSGFQRVMNGTMDIGCYEGDWSATYARDLGSARYVTVSDVSSNVVENAEKKVSMPASATLTLTWAIRPGTSASRVLSFVVSFGTLTVAREGGETVICTASPDIQTVVLSGAETERLVLTTSADGAATLLKCGQQIGLMLIIR